MKVKVLCKVIHVGDAYGKTNDVITLPDEVAKQYIKQKRAEEVKETTKQPKE